MQAMTGCHEKTCEILTDLINHGYGHLECKIESLSNGSVRVLVLSGKQYVFFIKKKFDFDKEKLL